MCTMTATDQATGTHAEKSVCFCIVKVGMGGKNTYAWYGIDDSMDGGTVELGHADDIVHNFGCEGLGSKIYIFGGAVSIEGSTFCDDVYVRDKKTGAWTKASSLNVRRCSPFMNSAVCDGKIFVFGITRENEVKTWVEFFDPISNKWNLLPDSVPEDPSSITSDLRTFDPTKHVLARHPLSPNLYAFDLKTTRWSLIGKDYNGNVDSNYSFVVVDGILYHFVSTDAHTLYACDLCQGSLCGRNFFETSVKGLKVGKHLPPWDWVNWPPGPYLVDVGKGKMCVLWSRLSMIHDDKKTLEIHFTKFTVSKQSDGTFQANDKSHKVYYVPSFFPDFGGYIGRCVAVYHQVNLRSEHRDMESNSDIEMEGGGNPKREREGKEGLPPRAKARIEREEVSLGSQEKEKIVYFRARKLKFINNKPSCDWYAVVKSSQGDGGGGKYVAQKLPHQQPKATLYPFSAAVGSVIYVFGGFAFTDNWVFSGSYNTEPFGRVIPDLWCFDTGNPYRNWFRGASMCKPRENTIHSYGYSSVMGGKIYVTGGFVKGEKDLSPWGEMYDPELDMWSPLSQPSPHFQLLKITEFDSSKHVLSCLPDKTNCLACYDVSDESWRLIRYDGDISPNTIVDGGTVFSFWTFEYVSAYSLFGKSWGLGRVNGLRKFLPIPDDRCPTPDACLVGLGPSRFGVIWHKNTVVKDKKLGHVHFVIFTVTKNHQDDCPLEAKVELHEYLHIDKTRYFLDASCVMLG